MEAGMGMVEEDKSEWLTETERGRIKDAERGIYGEDCMDGERVKEAGMGMLEGGRNGNG